MNYIHIALIASLAAGIPAWADPGKNESGHHWNDGPAWTDAFEAEREARQHFEEHAREERKFYEEQDREARKYYEELAREDRKHREEMRRERRKHAEEMQREAWKDASSIAIQRP